MGHPDNNHGTEAALFHWTTSRSTRERRTTSVANPHPEYLHTTPEDMGPKVERIIQKHDKAATLDDSNTGGTTHQIQIIRDIQGQWNGSFKYTAPSQELAEKQQKEMNTCACLRHSASRAPPRRDTQTPDFSHHHQTIRVQKKQRRGGTAALSPPTNKPIGEH